MTNRDFGAALRRLADTKLITIVGRTKSRRREAHARNLERWAVRDETEARRWLQSHAAGEPPPADPAEPFAV